MTQHAFDKIAAGLRDATKLVQTEKGKNMATKLNHNPQPKPVMRDTKDLRAFLVEQMNGVATGEVNMDTAKGVSNLAQQIYNTLNIEIKMAIAKEKMEGGVVGSVSFID